MVLRLHTAVCCAGVSVLRIDTISAGSVALLLRTHLVPHYVDAAFVTGVQLHHSCFHELRAVQLAGNGQGRGRLACKIRPHNGAAVMVLWVGWGGVCDMARCVVSLQPYRWQPMVRAPEVLPANTRCSCWGGYVGVGWWWWWGGGGGQGGVVRQRAWILKSCDALRSLAHCQLHASEEAHAQHKS